jgi:tRNA (adenine37-N6)-methyltransferase
MITTLLCSLILHSASLTADHELPAPPGAYAKPVKSGADVQSGFTACGGRDLMVREISPQRRGAKPDEEFTVFPVGHVRDKDSKKSIVLDKKYVPATLGMKAGDRIWVIWWFDRNDTPEKRAILQVHPRGNPKNPLRGVFATRSPMRPNLIALTACKVTAVKENVIEVEGLDAFDGTPVLDIKTAYELR